MCILNMDFILLFTLTTNLSFTIRYAINSEARQDYFVFNGIEDSLAHLFREDNILNLYIRSDNSSKLYQLSTIGDEFEFCWNEFEINGEAMEIVKYDGLIGYLSFNEFIFTSPYIEIIQSKVEDKMSKPVYNLDGINYAYILLIVFCAGLLLKTDVLIKLLHRHFEEQGTKISLSSKDELSDDDGSTINSTNRKHFSFP